MSLLAAASVLCACEAPPGGSAKVTVSSTAAPSSVVGASWLVDNADGTYSISPDADCHELELRVAPDASRALRPASVSPRLEAGKLVIDELGVSVSLPRVVDTTLTTRVRGASSGQAPKRSQMASGWLSEAVVTPWIGDDALLLRVSDGGADYDSERWALRVYAVLDEAEAVVEHVSARMPEAAMRSACRRDRRWHEEAARVSFSSGPRPPWTRAHALLRTYAGCGHDEDVPIEVYVRRARDVTLVLAVMGLSTDEPSEAGVEVARFVEELGRSGPR